MHGHGHVGNVFFLCLSWSCRNFFLLHGYGKILVVVYRYVKNFGCGKIW